MILFLAALCASAEEPNYTCFDSANYTLNSTYHSNLITLLSFLSSHINLTGFYSASAAQQVYASALFRTDAQLNTCRTCVQNATAELLRWCPNRLQGILWTEFCTVRYSNESIFGIPTNDWYSYYWIGERNVVDVSRFRRSLNALLGDLRLQAASGGSLMKIAAGNRTDGGFQSTVYVLLQCTPDVSEADCLICLNSTVAEFVCCNESIEGRRIYVPSCTLQYDTLPFYNITRIQEVRAMISTPSSGSSVDDNKSSTRAIIIIVVSVLVVLLVASPLAVFLIKRSNKKPSESIQYNVDISTVESLQFDFGKIRSATDYFSEANKLGKGGFGFVYKLCMEQLIKQYCESLFVAYRRGNCKNGQDVAVKRLSRNSAQGDAEFKNEVLLLAKLQHRNLVRLLGFSLEGNERILVYEFAQNASLDHFLFNPVGGISVDWEARYKIIKGISKGLLYLHEDSRFRIIHRDLKASNILLDGEMNPKIADFGMARLFPHDETEISTSRIVGTYGYMAPEYETQGHISVKIDVFSFGVLVLEIVSGQKNNSFRNQDRRQDMLSFAWRNWYEGSITRMIDPVLRTDLSCLQDVLRCIHIGLLCVQENADNRPTMASVVVMLNSFSTTMPVPSQPSSGLDSDDRSTPLNFTKSSSVNDVSNSEIYPR